MSLTETPTTELQAVNTLIGMLGEAPVSTLSGQLTFDVQAAQNFLLNASRAIQTQGWQFNTEDEFTLSPDVDGYISAPDNYMRVNPDPRYHQPGTITRRGTRLYDRVNHTYVFESPVIATVILLLPFDELPQSARHYITVTAGRVFQDQHVGDKELHQYSERDELMARATLIDQEGGTAAYNILNKYPKLRR